MTLERIFALPGCLPEYEALAGPSMGSVQQRMVLGFEQCLADALWAGPQPADEDATPGGSGNPAGGLGGQRACLALRLLQLTSTQPAPNLAHLLLGFDVSRGPKGGATDRFCSVRVCLPVPIVIPAAAKGSRW